MKRKRIGASTIPQLTRRCIRIGIWPTEEQHHYMTIGLNAVVARALRKDDDDGTPLAIVTPQRRGRSHIWKLTEMATFEDCQYKLALDVTAALADFRANERFRDYIEERFQIRLDLPALDRPPTEWYTTVMQQYREERENMRDEFDAGFTEDPDDDEDC